MAIPEDVMRLAQPDDDHPIEAWFMDDSDADQRLPHRREPNEPATLAQLRELGVLSWRMDAANYQTDPKLAAVRQARGYSYEDVITVSPEKLPGYEAKIKSFYEEHMHSDEEIRYILEGEGYFDVRDLADRWIRIRLTGGDMITLPAGIYHRFTLDETNYVKAARYFIGEPVWTPLNRPQEAHPARQQYVQELGSSAVAAC